MHHLLQKMSPKITTGNTYFLYDQIQIQYRKKRQSAKLTSIK